MLSERCGHDTAILHANISQLGYHASLRTVYRSLRPLRTGTTPAPLTLPPKVSQVTSWLLHWAEDLNSRQPQLLPDLRGYCAQLDRLAEHVTSFAEMMTPHRATRPDRLAQGGSRSNFPDR